MGDIEAHVSAIREWLASYREDVQQIKSVMLSDAPSPRACYTLAGVLNYQIRKMDLTPDWTPEIGMVDDTMVLRTGASVFKINNLLELPAEVAATIDRLSAQDETVKAMLGSDYDKLFRRVRALVEREIHGRTPEEIFEDPAKRDRFLKELDKFVERYQEPTIKDPEAFHREVLSYIRAKLG